MTRIALLFLLGVISLNAIADVSSQLWASCFVVCCLLLLLVSIFSSCFRRIGHRALTIPILIVLAGLSRAGWHAQDYTQHRLVESSAGIDLLLTGVIASLPEVGKVVTKFEFTLDEIALQRAGLASTFPRHIRLGWYYGKPVQPGEHWQFLIRLKPPHGFMNPGGFDYEAWLYQHGIHATGYIRKSEHNRRLPDSTTDKFSTATQSVINLSRQKLNLHIEQALPDAELGGVIKALAIGSRKDISKQQWQTLLFTGTNHLMAISGLHIGLAAAFGFSVMLFLAKHFMPIVLLKRVPAQMLATIAALFLATAYALLSGLAIPAQRSLLMLLCFSIAWLVRRHFRPIDSLALALLAVLLLQPASVHGAGFWFSFLAVAGIMLAYQNGLSDRPWWQQLVLLQGLLSLCLFPVSLYLFQQVSVVSPVANLFMVPYVSMLVVPLILLSLILFPVTTTLSAYCLQLAHWLLQLIWPLLQTISQLDFAYQAKHIPAMLLLVLLAAVLLLLFPSMVRARLPALSNTQIRLLSLPCFFPILLDYQSSITEGDYLLDVLDVGQGTAVVIRTSEHTLVYDTGATFGDKLDAGSAVVVPFLRYVGVAVLDKLIISHGDRDHIGGASSILQAYPRVEIIGQQLDSLKQPNKKYCRAGESWQWDGVFFRFLHPETTDYKKSNNISCVLKISSTGGSVLLTGDIEKKVERQLVASGLQHADILVVPHHGSRTSSTKPFIQAVLPDYAVITAGYRNRYRLPAKDITQRYAEAGSQMMITGITGAIHFDISHKKGISAPKSYRENSSKYWNHDVSGMMQ